MASSSFKGFLDAETTDESMTVDRKTELLYILSGCPDMFKRILKDWYCHDIREILCKESDDGRKYTRLTKHEMISKLLDLILKKKNQNKV